MGNVNSDFNVAPLVAPNSQIRFTPTLGFSDREAPSGFIGGGQIGYNWQYSPLIVVGLEADIQGAIEKDTTNNLTQSFSYLVQVPGFTDPQGCGSPTFPAPPCTAVTSYTTQIDWFGTVRGRIG